MLRVGRWILVLPAAIAAYVVVNLLVGIASEGGKDALSQLVNSFVAPAVLVYAGAYVAPVYRFVVAVVLAVAHTVFGVYAWVVLVTASPDSSGTGWLTFTSFVTIAGVATACWLVTRLPEADDVSRQ